MFHRRQRGWNRDVEVAETKGKGLLFYGFQRTGKAMGQVFSVLVENKSRNKCFFQVKISLILYGIAICDLFTDCYRQIIFTRRVVFLNLILALLTCVGPRLKSGAG
jgi:hypothetical protein